jgi:hypothetical protein
MPVAVNFIGKLLWIGQAARIASLLQKSYWQSLGNGYFLQLPANKKKFSAPF